MTKTKPKAGIENKCSLCSKNEKKKYVFMILVSTVFIAAIVISSILLLNHTLSYEYVAIVNNERIEEREFLRQLDLERANTYSYFKQKYNADVSGDFWNKNFNGEVPAKYAKDRALKECISIKIQQALAKKNGLIDDITYDAFLKKLSQENKRRKDAVSKRQVVYGPIQYDENGYFNYVFSNLIMKLKEKLADTEYKPTDAELKAYYERVRNDFYKEEDTIDLQVIYVSYGQQSGTMVEVKRKEANDMMREVKLRVDQGHSFESILKSYPEQINNEEKRINRESASSYSKVEPILFDTAKKLEANQISDVFDEVIQRKIGIIKVLGKEDGGYKAFEDIKDSVILKYVEQKYLETLEKLINQANVEINEAAYNKIHVR